MMKRLRGLFSNLFAIVALGALVIGLALSLSAQRGKQEQLAGASQSPIPTPLPTVPFTSPIVEPVPTWSPPTPLPDLGVRVGDFSEVFLSTAGTDITIEKLLNTDLDANILVGNAKVEDGVTVIAADLNTGLVQRLSRVANAGIEEPHISGRYVVWVESIDNRQLHAYDLIEAREFILGQDNPYQPDLKDNILVWQGNAGENWGIYGNDLEIGQDFIIAEGSSVHSLPRVCSREWIIYLRNVEEGRPGAADLHAHNLITGEDIFVGSMPFPRDASAGRQHACDDNWVAWIGTRAEQDETTYEQHLYNLTTRVDQVLNIPISGLPSPVLLDNSILISTVGFDLELNAPFSILSGLPLEQVINGHLVMSDNRIIWTASALNDSMQHLYTAFIERD